MKVRVIHPGELSPPEATRWAELREANPALGSPYFCPGFTSAVAAVRNDVRIGVVESDNRIVGFLPFQVGRLGVGKPVGGALSDFHGLIAPPEFDADARTLVAACGLSALDFDHVLAGQLPFAPYHRARAASPYMDLSRGYEAFAAARRAQGSEQIKKTGTLRRKLEREAGPLRFEHRVVDPAALRTLMAWKTAQYLESGCVDIFTYGWTVRLLERLMATETPDFAGVLSALYVNGRMIAAHFGMRSRTVWHYWFPSYDQEFHKFSPGLILLLMMAEHAASMGVRTLDMGKGDTLYKQRLASGSVELAEGSVEVRSLASAARRLHRNVRTLVNDTPLARLMDRMHGRVARRLRFQ